MSQIAWTMRTWIHLLWCLLVLPLQLSSVWADEGRRDDPDTWSSAFERAIAAHWLADGKANGAVSDRQFIIVCDPGNARSYIRSLRHLASLRDDYLANGKAWDEGKNSRYPCIGKNSFRLDRDSGRSAAPPSNQDDTGALDASYRVVKADANSQIVELRFRDLNTGIYDSFFKYEVRNDEVIPLESWVVSRGLLALVVAGVIVSLLFVSAMVGVFRLFRLLRARFARRQQAP